MNAPAWVGLLGGALGIAGILGAALAVFRSSYRKGIQREREDYIDALEDRNKLLEATVERQTRELDKASARLDEAQKRYYELRGSLNTVAALAMGRCPHFDLDEETGGCTHCNRGLFYGKEGKKG
jgi:hypothetical protein